MSLRAWWATVAVIAIGRKNPPTPADVMHTALDGAPKKYRYTQPANQWKLRMARRDQKRRSA